MTPQEREAALDRALEALDLATADALDAIHRVQGLLGQDYLLTPEQYHRLAETVGQVGVYAGAILAADLYRTFPAPVDLAARPQ